MPDIRGIYGGSNDLAWIEGVGWGLGLVFLSGLALALLSLPLLRRGRAAKHPGFNWKQSALLAGEWRLDFDGRELKGRYR